MIFQQFLPTEFKDEAEELFFFHRDQKRYRLRIIHCIEHLGAPEVRYTEAGMTFALSGFSGGQQSWFIMSTKGRLQVEGILILAIDHDTLHIVHWVKRPDVDSGDIQSAVMRYLTIFARRLKGVTRIKIDYTGLEVSLERAERLFSI